MTNFYLFLWKRIKRGDNRDKRVELLQLFARTNFPSVKYMEYAVQVETYTLSKSNNLVLNVDGAIGSLFLDLLAGSGMFTKPEIDEIVEIGYLNGLFVLARSIGLIGWVGLLSRISLNTEKDLHIWKEQRKRIPLSPPFGWVLNAFYLMQWGWEDPFMHLAEWLWNL